MNLAAYKTRLEAILGAAVDSSTWTDAIEEEALRAALTDVNLALVYETQVTVTTAGYQQAVAPTSVLSVLSVMYPWDETTRWRYRGEPYRWTGDNTVRFETVQPQVGEKIACRYTLAHAIEDLDSAVATTVPDSAQEPLLYLAAAQAGHIRLRQLTENPAVPKGAAEGLRDLIRRWEARGMAALRGQPAQVSWNEIGL